MSLTPEFLEQVRISSERPFAFVERCGVKTLEVAPGRCHMRMQLEGNINHIGTMYAGALFTLAELPGGVIYLTTFDSSRFYPIVKSLNIRFRRPATTDIDVEAQLDAKEAARISAQAEKEGKCDYNWTLELKDAKGEVVAIAECVYQLRRIGS
jgi:acyl-coenzyme A thioesterase PaaI-like protein